MKTKITLGIGFAIFMPAFFFFDTSNLFPALVISAAIHETGHILAIRFFGAKVSLIRLEFTGAAISYDNHKVSYLADALIALSGPFFGLVFAIISASLSRYSNFYLLLSGSSFSFSILNLLPARNLDGGRILTSLTARSKGDFFAEHMLVILSCITAFAVLTFGALVLFYSRTNFSFLIVGIWLFFDFARCTPKNKPK